MSDIHRHILLVGGRGHKHDGQHLRGKKNMCLLNHYNIKYYIDVI